MGLAEFICAAILSMGWANADVACKHMPTVVQAAEKNGINPHILASLIYVESRWQPKAHSGANACGLTQIIPRFTKKSKAGYVSCRQLQQNPKTFRPQTVRRNPEFCPESRCVRCREAVILLTQSLVL